MNTKVKIGDTVLIWRPSLMLPSVYESKVVLLGRTKYDGMLAKVKPVHGLFKFCRWVNLDSHRFEGVISAE